MLYEYLKTEYRENEPIFLSELNVADISSVNVRQQLKKLTDKGLLKRYDSGIYFIPGSSIFKGGAQLSFDKVVQKKYLEKNGRRCGYISGVLFANQIGVTSQVPMCYELVTNKATKDYREVTLAKARIVLRKPKIKVTDDNYKALQFLDLVRNIELLADIPKDELSSKLINYLQSSGLSFNDLEKYLSYYPDKVYRNLYEVGILYGISVGRKDTV